MNNKANLTWESEYNNTFIIGEVLNSDERYYFIYNEENVKKAIEEGFKVLEGFPRVNSKYFSEEPFRLFTRWAIENGKVEEMNFELFKELTHKKFRFEESIQDDNKEDIA